MLISIDHGNKQVKTIHHAPFTSGLVCSEVRPFGGETLTYQGQYYTLTDQRIPYRRDKTEDERFFVLTLFAIAYELEAASFYGACPVRVQLAVGLPPAHYGAQQKRFAEYFLNRGTVSFTLHDKQYEILIDEVSCYPQSYAAAITVFQTLQSSPRALIIDIGGFTADYLLPEQNGPTACENHLSAFQFQHPLPQRTEQIADKFPCLVPHDLQYRVRLSAVPAEKDRIDLRLIQQQVLFGRDARFDPVVEQDHAVLQ